MTTEVKHADYPHHAGKLYDCPACEARCHCTGDPADTECVFSGDHMPEGMRFIAYFDVPFGRNSDPRAFRSLRALTDAFVAYGRETGLDRSDVRLTSDGGGGFIREYDGSAFASVYAADTPDAWKEAQRFAGVGCPFDYPTYVMRFGPRGGVVRENA
jgi:hypothetical protein